MNSTQNNEKRYVYFYFNRNEPEKSGRWFRLTWDIGKQQT
jgi:hypothetical protein